MAFCRFSECCMMFQRDCDSADGGTCARSSMRREAGVAAPLITVRAGGTPMTQQGCVSEHAAR